MSQQMDPIRERHPWSNHITKREKRAPLLGMVFFLILIMLIVYARQGLQKSAEKMNRKKNELNIHTVQHSAGQNVLVQTPEDGIPDNVAKQGKNLLFVSGPLSKFMKRLIFTRLDDVFIHGDKTEIITDLLVNFPVKQLYLLSPVQDSSLLKMFEKKEGLTIIHGNPVEAKRFLSVGSELTIQYLVGTPSPTLKINYLNTVLMVCPYGLSVDQAQTIAPEQLKSYVLICGTAPSPQIVQWVSPHDMIIPEGDFPGHQVIALNSLNRPVSLTLSEKTGTLVIE
jgi:hypothetical protein